MKLSESIIKQILRKWKKYIYSYIILGIVSSFMTVLSIRLYENIINSVSLKTIPLVGIIIYSVLTIGSYVINYLCNYPGTKLSSGLYLEFKSKALEQISKIQYIEYCKIGTGKLMQIVENGANAGKYIYIDFYFRCIRELLPDMIFSIVLISILNIKISSIILVGYVIVFICTNLLLKKLYSIKERLQTNEEQFGRFLTRGFMEFVTFRINKRFGEEIKNVNAIADDITNSKTSIIMVHELFFTVFAILIGIIKVIIIILSFTSINISVGSLVAIITLVDKVYNPIAIFNVIFVQKKLEQISLDRYMSIFELEKDPNLYNGKQITFKDFEVSVDNVSLSIDNKKILSNINVKFENCKTTAIVGESGSGKSTLIKSILGLYKITDGSIIFGNEKLEDVQLDSLYSHITYIGQETPVFDGTIRENIVFNRNVSDEEIINVMNLVELNRYLEKLPNTLDTEIGEKGVMLSGGERQRIALARIFFDDSNLIILDEATSALDNVLEESVMNNIVKYLSNKTIIIIAHRLNSIKNVDNIIVMKDGKVLDEGTYDYLLNNNSYFSELCRLNNFWG